MITALILVAVLTLCYTAFKIKRRHMVKCVEKIPGDKGYPIIGNALSYYKLKTHGIIKHVRDSGKKYQEYGIFRSWVGNLLLVGVSDPKYIEIVANSPHAVRKGPLMGALLQGYPTGVFTTDDIPKWKLLRKPLTKALTKKHLENEYHRVFLRKNKQYVKYLKENQCGKEISVKNELRNQTTDIFSETLLGVETNEVMEAKFNFLDYVVEFIEDSFSMAAVVMMDKVFDPIRPLLYSSKTKQAINGLNGFLSEVFQERMKKKNTNGDIIYYPDFLLKRKMEHNLTSCDIERELLDIVFAGADTSAVALSSTLLFLAMFPEIQEEAYQEQVSILGESSMQEPTPEDLASMVYLTRVLKEAIRFSSPPAILKYSTGDIKLDSNYTIPKGTYIIVGIDVVCFDERYWEKPMSFYPDHFLPEKEAERPSYAYPVFGIGPRSCPGVQYGMSSMKTVLSFILRNFRMSTTVKFEDLQFEYNLLREFNTYMVKFEERTVSSADDSYSL